MWNDKLGKDGVTIDGVVLLFHGTTDRIGFSFHTNKYDEDVLMMDNISKLDTKTMDTLIILSCKAGAIPKSGTNFATTMARRMNATYLIASDGNVGAYNITEKFSIGTDKTYILLETTKNPVGFKVYTKDSDGIVSARKIGTIFKGINNLIFAAKITPY